MPSLKELRTQLKELRKVHCPPVSRMRKMEVASEVERTMLMVKAEKPVEKPVEKKAEKKEKKPVEKPKKEVKKKTST